MAVAEQLVADAGSGPEVFNVGTGARECKHRMPHGAHEMQQSHSTAVSPCVGILSCDGPKGMLVGFNSMKRDCSLKSYLGEKLEIVNTGVYGKVIVLATTRTTGTEGSEHVAIARTQAYVACFASESGALLWRKQPVLRQVASLEVDDEAGVVLVGSKSGQLVALAQPDGRELLHWQAHSLAVTAIASDGLIVATCGYDRLLSVHALQGAHGAQLLALRLERPLTALALAPASSHALVGDSAGSLMAVPLHGHNGRAGVHVQHAPGSHNRNGAHNGKVTSISACTTSSTIASASSGEDCVRLWQLSLGTEQPFAPLRDIRLGSTGVHFAAMLPSPMSSCGIVPSWPSKLSSVERSEEEELDGEIAGAFEPGSLNVHGKQDDLFSEPLIEREAERYQQKSAVAESNDIAESDNANAELEELKKQHAELYDEVLNLMEQEV